MAEPTEAQYRARVAGREQGRKYRLDAMRKLEFYLISNDMLQAAAEQAARLWINTEFTTERDTFVKACIEAFQAEGEIAVSDEH